MGSAGTGRTNPYYGNNPVTGLRSSPGEAVPHERGLPTRPTVYGDLDEDGVYSTFTVVSETTRDGLRPGGWPDDSLLLE